MAVADTHLFQEDLGALPDGDVFIHAGDMLRGGTLDEFAVFLPWLAALPHRHKVIVAGNHDRCFEVSRPEAEARLPRGVHYLQDSGIELDGVQFWGSPWQPAYNDWAFNLKRGAPLAAKWALIPQDLDILVTHCPPAGYGDQSGMRGRHGCLDLIERVREVRPAGHLFGHIHQAGGLWKTEATTFANVTTWECERMPTVLDYDPTTKNITPVSVPPRTPPD